MKFYTGWEWLLIDAANQAGKDKLLFSERITWAQDNLHQLERLADWVVAKKRPLYVKAVMAIRKAQAGIPTGHMVHVDASASGIQIMSALAGCERGAEASGIVNPDVRANAYKAITEEMNSILSNPVAITAEDAKRAGMTTMYGSKAVPKELFGEDTPQLAAFYKALVTVVPGAWEVLQDLLSSWQPYALSHSFKLPDGFDAVIKVMTKQEVRIEIDELNHATFTYEFFDNEGQKKGISLPANITHGVDGFMVREMHRRCNYDVDMVRDAWEYIDKALTRRKLSNTLLSGEDSNAKTGYYYEQYQRNGMISVAILPYLEKYELGQLDSVYLEKLLHILDGMLQYESFELVTIHDSFASHPNNVNWVRWWYKEIMAEIADSNLLDDLLSQLNGMPCKFNKLSANLGDKIRKSNYALS